MGATIVQNVPCTFLNNGTTLSGTLNGVTAGNTLFFVPAYYQNGASPAIPTVTDNGTAMTADYTPAQNNDGINNNVGNGYFRSSLVAAGTHNFVCTLAAGSFANGTMYEVAGLTATPFDQKNVANATTAQLLTVGATPTLAQANELVLSSIIVISVTGPGQTSIGISDPPSGFTSLFVAQNTALANGVEQAWREAPSTAGIGVGWTWTDSSTGLSQGSIATYKESGAGGATTQQVDTSNRPRPGRGPYSKGRYFRPDTTAYTSAAPAITGSGSPTDPSDTSAGTGSTNVSGSGTPSDSADLSAGTGSTGVSGSGAPTDSADVSAGTGTTKISGSGSPTDSADVSAGSGTAGTTGSGSPTDSSDTSAGTGSTSVSGSGTPTDAADASSGTGATAVAGSGSPTDQADVSAGTGLVGGAGSGSPTDQPDTSSGTGSTSVAGSGNPTDQADIAAGTGTTKVSGTGSPTDSADVSAGSGSVGGAGSGSPTDPSDGSSGTGSTSVAGSGAPTDSHDVSAGSGNTSVTGFFTPRIIVKTEALRIVKAEANRTIKLS